MGCTTLDLTIDAALADPMITAVMRADRVDPQRFEALLRAAARAIAPARPEPKAFGFLAGRYVGTAQARLYC